VPDREKIQTQLCPHCLNTFPSSGHLHSFDDKKIVGLADDANTKIIKMRSYYPPMINPGYSAFLGKDTQSLELLKLHRDGFVHNNADKAITGYMNIDASPIKDKIVSKIIKKSQGKNGKFMLI
jgi:hypothetical protein